MITIRAKILLQEKCHVIGEIVQVFSEYEETLSGTLRMTNDAWRILIEAFTNYAVTGGRECIADDFTFIEEK